MKLYRIIKAEGRELTSLGMANDSDFVNDIHIPNAGSNQMQNYTQLYSYDELGNIESVNSQGRWTRSYVYDTQTNRLLNTGSGLNYTYDAQGNMVSMPHLSTMEWDSKGNLTKTVGGTVTTYYRYDSTGNRVRKIAHKTGAITEERIYVGNYELYRKKVGGTLNTERETTFVSDDKKRIAIVDTRNVPTPVEVTIRYQYDNHLGSACLELDGSGAVISYEEYHPFGTTSYRAGRNATETSLKRYKYVGKERDEETGLYYYGARYYAAWLCRFVSVDPLQFKYPHNTPYQYAGNKPISYIDLDGLEEAKLFDPSGTNIRVVSTNQVEYDRIVKALNLLKLYDPKGFEKVLQSGKPIDIKFSKLNDEKVYEALKTNPGTSTFQNNSSINIIKGSTNTEFEFCGDGDVIPNFDQKGNIISGKSFRIPDINEQEEKRKEFGVNYLPKNDLREIDPSDNSYADVKSITIELDPVFTKTDKELTKVLGHEFFGHTSFNIFNSMMGWIWQELEEIIKPQKKGHAEFNPGGTLSDDVERNLRKKYSGLNEQYKKNIK